MDTPERCRSRIERTNAGEYAPRGFAKEKAQQQGNCNSESSQKRCVRSPPLQINLSHQPHVLSNCHDFYLRDILTDRAMTLARNLSTCSLY